MELILDSLHKPDDVSCTFYRHELLSNNTKPYQQKEHRKSEFPKLTLSVFHPKLWLLTIAYNTLGFHCLSEQLISKTPPADKTEDV